MVTFITPDFPERSELLFGADLISAAQPSEHYQMVPLRGTRAVQASSFREPFAVFSRDPEIAQLLDQGRSPAANNRLTPRLVIGEFDLRFSVFGKNEGRTQIVAVDKFGATRSLLTVSVKKIKPVTCKYWFLTDKMTSNPNGIQGIIRAAASKIKALYLNQANVDLIEMGGVEELAIKDFNLSGLDDNKVKTLFLHEPFGVPESMFLEDFLSLTVNGRGGAGIDVNILVAWDLEFSPAKAKTFPIEGSTRLFPLPANVSIVEVHGSLDVRVTIWAHEIGHAIGLPGHQLEPGFLMSKLRGDSWRLRADEIDEINKSGKSFRV